MCHFFHCYFAVCFGVHLIYYIYARKIFHNLFSERWFLCERLFFPSRFLFFKYVTWRFSPCGRVFLFFCLDTKEKETKRKNQGYVSGPTPERPFWRWKMNSLRCTTLKQHFSAPPGHSSAHAPPPRPFHYTPRRFAVGSGWRFCLTFGLRCWLFVSASPCLWLSLLCAKALRCWLL